MDEPRSERALRDPERAQLVAFLDDNRDEVLAGLDGLTDEQARRRLVPSRTTPLAIVKHAIFVEKVWFHVSLGGQTEVSALHPGEGDVEPHLLDEDRVLDDRQRCRQ